MFGAGTVARLVAAKGVRLRDAFQTRNLNAMPRQVDDKAIPQSLKKRIQLVSATTEIEHDRTF